MNIPKKFNLLGQTITVEYDESLHHNDDVHGWAKYRQNKIVLQPSTKQAPITRESLEHNFMHELTHFVLYMSGEDSFEVPLHQRECLVDRIAGLMHQAYNSSEGNLDNETNTEK